VPRERLKGGATETEMNYSPSCSWCNQPFRRRQSGGHSQRFCRPSCRRAFHAAARAWTLDALAEGRVTVGDFKNGLRATRALVSVAFSVSAPAAPGG